MNRLLLILTKSLKLIVEKDILNTHYSSLLFNHPNLTAVCGRLPEQTASSRSDNAVTLIPNDREHTISFLGGVISSKSIQEVPFSSRIIFSITRENLVRISDGEASFIS